MRAMKSNDFSEKGSAQASATCERDQAIIARARSIQTVKGIAFSRSIGRDSIPDAF